MLTREQIERDIKAMRGYRYEYRTVKTAHLAELHETSLALMDALLIARDACTLPVAEFIAKYQTGQRAVAVWTAEQIDKALGRE